MTSQTADLGERASGDERTEYAIGAKVSAAHFTSHVFYLVLPPLFPLLKSELNVGYVELGLAITLFNILTLVLQTPMGYAVDRFDARSILVAGLCLGGFAYLLFAAIPTYPCMMACFSLGGIANAVYHPANYSILSSSISPPRIGRMFSLHLFAGYLGSATAPAAILFLTGIAGYRLAVAAAGCLAFVVAVPLILDIFERSANARKASVPARDKSAATAPPVRILTPAVIALTGFFALISLSSTGISNFAGAGLHGAQAMSLESANIALTGYLLATALGVIAGGVIADRTLHHNAVAALGFALSAVFVLLVAVLSLPGLAVIALLSAAGFFSGIIQPSRDMMVREAVPEGAAGRVFGVVTTGFNVGQAVGPLVFGIVLDHGHPAWIFAITAGFMALTALSASWSQWRKQRVQSVAASEISEAA
ncbi:MAG: MFS transporter [Methylobacteriaceae bacterium]|nr:MFS transporter [Methylobacteriaceae bacterium]